MKIPTLLSRLLFVLVLMFSASSAFAHAKLLSSNPKSGEILQQAPNTVELVFSVEVQPVEASTVVVVDKDGRRVDKNDRTLSEDRKTMRVGLEDLRTGTYTVQWRALSADDHPIKGEFTFEVAPAARADVTAPSNRTTVDHSAMAHETMNQASGTSWLQSVVRWLMYLAMFAIFGGFGFWLAVLKPLLGDIPNMSDDERTAAIRNGENGLRRIIFSALILLPIVAIASLVLQVSAVFDVDLAQALAPDRVYQVLAETSFGVPWILQISAVLALLAIAFFVLKLSGTAKDLFYRFGFALSALLFLTPSLSGHARAAQAEYGFAVFSDWLHLAAGGVWIGGLFQMVSTVPKAISGLSSAQKTYAIGRVIGNFNKIAIPSVILLALTGIYNSWIHIDSFAALVNTTYGLTVLGKIALFIPMVVLGGINAFRLRPRVDQSISETGSEDKSSATKREFFRNVKVEVALAAVVLLLAAILAFLTPAREHPVEMGRSLNAFKNY